MNLSNDLPEEEFLYISSKTRLINVDLLVINERNEILLSWRDDEYCGTGWHIPGGIIRHRETMMERLETTAKRELGFVPEFDDKPAKISEIILDQEFRDHFISHLFIGRCYSTDIVTCDMDDTHEAGNLCWFDHYPEAGIVYSQDVYKEYLKELFRKGMPIDR